MKKYKWITIKKTKINFCGFGYSIFYKDKNTKLGQVYYYDKAGYWVFDIYKKYSLPAGILHDIADFMENEI